jgi:hypothetical protein
VTGGDECTDELTGRFIRLLRCAEKALDVGLVDSWLSFSLLSRYSMSLAGSGLAIRRVSTPDNALTRVVVFNAGRAIAEDQRHGAELL